MLKKLVYSLAGMLLLLVLSMGGTYLWLVVFFPGEEILQDNIAKILAVESPVYYRGGEQKLGVVFKTSHRQHIPYAQIPQAFVHAIVSAEDRNFFSHCGIDILGIARAMLVNVKAGRVVQGGSTITQQAAKNLFKRQERTFSAKLQELLFALRLEYHYSKEKILEFYANQFYVSGNGHGLGVAATYYFDKQVSELNVLECAFIAGSVKRPNYYNPFIKKDEKAAAFARDKAKERAHYVLGQMARNGYLSAAEYERYRADEIRFEKGRMYYSLNTIMDQVKAALGEPEIEEAFQQHGIENVATAGIKIYTTVEKGLQDGGLYALRKELSRLDVDLRGYDHRQMQDIYSRLQGNGELSRHNFLVGRVSGIQRNDSPAVEVSFKVDGDRDGSGVIDRQGLMNLVAPLARFLKHRWTEAGAADVENLLDQIRPGDLVYVSVREDASRSETALLDLEKYPELQGGLMVMKDGEILVMVGGYDNKYYNRAIHAKRPMGSVIKPLVYNAAMQLGWNNLDALANTRDMFAFQKSLYFPRPDHDSPHANVSMSWAGVYSENVATVWLLYHLCDQLSPGQFREVVDHLELGRRKNESYEQYRVRIRDDHGLLVDSGILESAAFENAVEKVAPDLFFAGNVDDYNTLLTFHYRTDMDVVIDEDDTSEADSRRDILKRSFVDLQLLSRQIAGRDTMDAAALYASLKGRLYRSSASAAYVFAGDTIDPHWQRVETSELRTLLAFLDRYELQQFRREIQLDGLLQVGTVDMLEKTVAEEYERLSALDPYSFEVLQEIREFRVLVGLHYLIAFCKKLGVESQLDPVLSFPLGSNVISLLESALLYEGLVQGKIHAVGSEESGPGIRLIERIESREGEIIFQPEKRVRTVGSPEISLMTGDILRNVVRFGTGGYAHGNVRLHSPDAETESRLQSLDWRLPIGGKTGTANRFTNSAFAGFLPQLADKGAMLSWRDGYVVTAYVGFDDNKPMVHKSTRISGSSGALRVWTRMVNDILLEKDYGGSMDLIDLSFSGFTEFPLSFPDIGPAAVTVDTTGDGLPTAELAVAAEEVAAGLPNAASDAVHTYSDKVISFVRKTPSGTRQLERFFIPFWQVRE